MSTTTWIEIGLTNAGGATLLALVALVVGRISARPEVAHVAWLVVLLRLVAPPLVPVGLPLLSAPPEPGSATGAVDVAALNAAAGRVGATGLSLETALLFVWLGGAVLVGLIAVARVLRFRRLARLRGQPADATLVARVENLARRMGLPSTPRVILLDATVSPMLWAAGGKPNLVLPTALLGRLGAVQLDALLAHELAHLSRRDHWARFAELAAKALYWWHPVTWWAARRMRRAEELCCDEAVARILPGHRRAYADCLLATIRFLANRPSPKLALASGLGNLREMKGRLTMILTAPPRRRLSIATRALLAASAVAAIGVFPALVPQASATAEPPPLNMELEGAPIGEVLRGLAEAGGVGLELDDSVDPKAPITVSLENVSLVAGAQDGARRGQPRGSQGRGRAPGLRERCSRPVGGALLR